jgi:hypothetical protein
MRAPHGRAAPDSTGPFPRPGQGPRPVHTTHGRDASATTATQRFAHVNPAVRPRRARDHGKVALWQMQERALHRPRGPAPPSPGEDGAATVFYPLCREPPWGCGGSPKGQERRVGHSLGPRVRRKPLTVTTHVQSTPARCGARPGPCRDMERPPQRGVRGPRLPAEEAVEPPACAPRGSLPTARRQHHRPAPTATQRATRGEWVIPRSTRIHCWQPGRPAPNARATPVSNHPQGWEDHHAQGCPTEAPGHAAHGPDRPGTQRTVLRLRAS